MTNTIKTLHSSGLRLISHYIPDSPTIALNIFVNAGSRFENSSNNGVAHFFEHMIFKGTQKRPLPNEIFYELELIGAEANAFTDKEYTTYVIKILKANFEKGVEILFDAFLHSLLDDKEVEKERRVIKEEMKMYEDDPSTFADEKFISNLYPYDSYGYDIVGTSQTLENINSSVIRDFYKNHYFFENTVIVASGDIEHSKLESLVNKYFDISRYSHGSVNNIPFMDKSFIEPRKIYKRDIQQSQFRLGTYTYSHSDINRFKALVALSILGYGAGSKLFVEVREKRGLVYGIYSTPINWSQSGYISITAGLMAERINMVENICFEEMQKMADGGFSDRDITRAKEQAKSSLLMNLDTNSNWVWTLGYSECVYNESFNIYEYIKNIDNVVREDILLASQTLISSKWQGTYVIPRDYDL